MGFGQSKRTDTDSYLWPKKAVPRVFQLLTSFPETALTFVRLKWLSDRRAGKVEWDLPGRRAGRQVSTNEMDETA